jgi:uncharacterized membrane protein YvbJ
MGDWVACPHCGEQIKRDAAACRHCGSDDRTGWSDATYMDGIDTPEAGDYEDGLENEGFTKPNPTRDRLVLGAVSLVLVALFLAWMLRSAF